MWHRNGGVLIRLFAHYHSGLPRTGRIVDKVEAKVSTKLNLMDVNNPITYWEICVSQKDAQRGLGPVAQALADCIQRIAQGIGDECADATTGGLVVCRPNVRRLAGTRGTRLGEVYECGEQELRKHLAMAEALDWGVAYVGFAARPVNPEDVAVRPAHQLVLMCSLPDHNEHSYGVGPGAIVGREDSCDVVVPLDTVSRVHGRFDYADGAWSYTDLGSSNGSAINGRLAEPKKKVGLSVEDEILVGEGKSHATLRVVSLS